jgi:SprT protein
MSAVEHPMHSLQAFLPDGSFEQVVKYLHEYKVHLTVTKARSSVLGDYRNAYKDKNHRISVNGNLNKFSFLITLIHEIAHLLTFEKYGHKVNAHGKEWKQLYSSLLAVFTSENIFPPDIKKALEKSFHNPAASSCSEDGLTRVLKNYDLRKEGFYLIEELAENAIFKTNDGRIFKKENKLRKRFRCSEIATGMVYLFSPVYEVKLVN